MASQEEKTSLIDNVRQLNKAFRDNHTTTESRGTKFDENRKKGCDELFEHIKNLIPEQVTKYAGYGKNEARVFEFKFKDELKFAECYAKDLLTKEDVIPRLQAYLDKEHSDEHGRAFYIYFNHIGRHQVDNGENKYGVFVNWDKESWETIKERLSAPHELRPNGINKREYIPREYIPHGSQGSYDQQATHNNRNFYHNHDDFPSRGGRGRGGVGRGRGGNGRGRGGRGMRISRSNDDHPSTSTTSTVSQDNNTVNDLPEKHDE
jgi:hypothetical protein